MKVHLNALTVETLIYALRLSLYITHPKKAITMRALRCTIVQTCCHRRCTFLLKFSSLCAGPLSKCVLCHPEHSGRASARNLATFPLGVYGSEIFWYFHWSSAHMNAPGFRRGNSFRLSLVNKLTFRLRHITQKLEDDVCNQSSGKISSLSCVQKRHIQYHNGCFFLSGDDAPLLQNFLIVATQPVDALDDKGVARF